MAGAIEDFLAMLAAERGAAANTLAAYRRDLEGAEEAVGPLEDADREAMASLGRAWAGLAPSSVARKSSALRQFYGFLVEEGLRRDDPSPALPRPATRRPLPRILSHVEVEQLFARAEQEAAGEKPGAVRLLALLELLYGSGLRATELVSLPLAAVPRDANHRPRDESITLSRIPAPERDALLRAARDHGYSTIPWRRSTVAATSA